MPPAKTLRICESNRRLSTLLVIFMVFHNTDNPVVASSRGNYRARNQQLIMIICHTTFAPFAEASVPYPRQKKCWENWTEGR